MPTAVVTTARSRAGGGLEHAEARLLGALHGRAEDDVRIRVAGGRSARDYAHRLKGTWLPWAPHRASPWFWAGADLVHLPGLALPPPRHKPFVVTFHDVAALHFPDEGTMPPWTADMVARARLLVTPSQFTADELHEHLGADPHRTRVVPNGLGVDVAPDTPPLADDELAALGIHGPYLLRTGGYTQRKNVPLLLEAWPRIRRELGVQLVLAGPPHAARDAMLARLPSREGIVVLDYLPSATIARLVRTAAAVVSPSRYEGFGLPMLEGMAAGVPVVALRTPFAEEVCEDSAVLVEDDATALADGVVRVLTDDALRAGLVESGLRRARRFSWERSAEDLLRAYADARGGA